MKAFVNHASKRLKIDENTLEYNEAGKLSAQPAVDGIKIGGRNYIKNSNFSDGINGWAANDEATIEYISQEHAIKIIPNMTATNPWASGVYTRMDEFEQTEYTLSAYIRADSTRTIGIIVGNRQRKIEITNQWEKYAITVAPNDNIVAFYSATQWEQSEASDIPFYIKQIKCEKGNKPTDWTPAPEDCLNAEIEIGGTNLYAGTKNWDSTAWPSNFIAHWEVAGTYKGLTVLRNPTAFWGLYQELIVKSNEIYTISAYAKLEEGGTVNGLCKPLYGDNQAAFNVSTQSTTIPADEWTRVNFTFKVTTGGRANFRIESNSDKLCVCGIKVERGNKPSDWAPAPEDKADASRLAELEAYIGYTDSDILGLEADFENNKFTRLAGAVGKSAGSDFDSFPMYGGRRRCSMLENGQITQYFGEAGYSEENNRIMVEQPAFYYKVVPLKLDPITNGVGYHLRKARYYISAAPKAGFKLHPAFYDENGNPVEKIYIGAYEGCLKLPPNASGIITDDRQIESFDGYQLYSTINVKPCSGKTQNLTRANAEQLAKNTGQGWHIETIKSVAANQLLMAVEYATFNMQNAIGKGVVNISDVSGENRAVSTGATASLGNASGMASGENGKVSVSYRGMENPWGNIWSFINGINIHRDSNGKLTAYICQDYNFAENKRNENYEYVGFDIPRTSGYVSAFGYSEKKDFVFIATEINGNTNLPVGDQYYCTTQKTDAWRTALFGGNWPNGLQAGAFNWDFSNIAVSRYRTLGCRLIFVPTSAAGEAITND